MATPTTLRRSTLTVNLDHAGPNPWPPPDADSVPDVVAVRLSEKDSATTSSFLRKLEAWGAGVVLDVPEAHLESYLDLPISAVRSRAESAQALVNLDRKLSGTSIGIEVLAIKPAAILHLREICSASPRVCAIATGPDLLYETYGLVPATDVDVLAYPRGQVIYTARLLGVPAIGRFSMAGMQSRHHAPMTAAAYSSAVGLQGGLCQNWKEVRECNTGFQPDAARVEYSQRVLQAMAEAYAKGLGAVSLDGRMIDIALIPVAKRTIQLAEQVKARRQTLAAIFADGRASPCA